MNKLTIILCILFSAIFLAVGVFIGIQIQKKDSIETSYSKEEAEEILKDYKDSKDSKDSNNITDKAKEAANNFDKAESSENSGNIISKGNTTAKEVNEAQSNEENVVNDMENELNSLSIRTFNAKFSPYFGKSQSSSQVRTLVSAIKASNAIDSEHQVTLEPSNIATRLVASKKYTVEPGYDNEGYVNQISIVEE